MKQLKVARAPKKDFVQLWHDDEKIIGSAYRSFIFGGRNSAGQ